MAKWNNLVNFKEAEKHSSSVGSEGEEKWWIVESYDTKNT